MSCLSDQVLSDFVDGRLDEGAQREAERHLQGCSDCIAVLAELTKLRHGDGGPLPPGTHVSRYEIGRVIGFGAGGAVYEGWDPQLKRKVAIKLLRPLAADGFASGAVEERLLREAQMMAKLADPNVVYVHDAGIFEGRVYIVMELVEGETLDVWLGLHPRAFPEILEAFLAAGRGLAKAHGAQLVHRDFKPQNVLVASDGRIRVSDFGLARPTLSTEPAPMAAGPTPGHAPTLAGGTPTYMAPEQVAGLPVDARSDQFSFCVALFMAVYGVHPYERWPPAGKEAPTVRPRPDKNAVPLAIYDALVPGLRLVPDERHPSMDDLLSKLQGARGGVPRWRWAVGAAAAVVVVFFAGWRGLHHGAAVCGDGKLRPHVEECDDGNQSDDDGCTSACLLCKGATTFASNGHCYSRHDEPKTWNAARAHCASLGADLASYTNNAEANPVSDQLLRGQPTGTWIGLRRPPGADFAWVTGDPWPSNLKEWWNQTPVMPGDDCVHEIWGPNEGRRGLPRNTRWQSAACDELRPYLCEKAGWTTFATNRHAYRMESVERRFPAAESACASAGGHLVTIDDQEEHRFVSELARGTIWIGLTDRDQRGRFVWLTGQPLTFDKFGPGEPDDPFDYIHCVVLDEDDQWHDRPCKDKHGSMCEVDF